jgi:thiamine biosynthesis lipoprotein
MRSCLVRRRATGAWLGIWCLLAAMLGGCGPREPWRQESYVFGTRIELLIQGVPEAKAQAAAANVLAEFDRLHRTYHAWQPSELTALNDALAAGKPSEVSPEMAGLLTEAKALAAQGDYLFDPGIGRLVALWGFQSDQLPTELPRTAVINALVAQRPTIAMLDIDGQRVSSRNRAIAIDFGGYLKGVALDRAAVLLKASGVSNALINIGGNIRALGSKEGRAWRVGIQHPRPETVGGVPLATLELRDGEAIGTSGDYHRFFIVDGRRYCHLLDPRSGRPAFGTAAVTVLIPPGEHTGTRSDALSKPIFVAGSEWLTMARKLAVAAVLRVDAGGTAEVTPAMKARLSIEAPDVRLVVRGA